MMRRRRRHRLKLLFAGLILGGILASGAIKRPTGAAEGTALSGSSSTQPSVKSLRIATFNIDGGMGADGEVDLDRIAKCLQRLDFIGLNEVHGDFSTNQAQTLSDKLHLPYLFAPAEHRWWHDSFGNAIFTDLPVREWRRIPLPNESFRALRNFVLTTADWNGTTIHILTTHTDWKSGGALQLKVVSDLFVSLPEPAILMGDLNTPDRDPQIQKLQSTEGMEDPIEKVRGEVHPRVDWIFLRGFKTLDAGSVDFGASDHPAYWAQIKLK